MGEVQGRRERSKQDKRLRIMAAARDVFSEKGYDNATTREIAERADVAIATLFVYAQDKRDLLFMLINETLDRIVEDSHESIPASASFVDKVMHLFNRQHEYFATEVNLSKAAMRESFYWTPFDGGDTAATPQPVEAARFAERHRRGLRYLQDLVAEEQQAGRLRRDLPPARIAWLIVSVYRAETLRWLHGSNPKPAAIRRELSDLMQVIVDGLVARDALSVHETRKRVSAAKTSAIRQR
jgi:AcrR family transcriptional regulator